MNASDGVGVSIADASILHYNPLARHSPLIIPCRLYHVFILPAISSILASKRQV